jgi:hypothetical protein
VTYFVDIRTQCYATDVTSQVRCLWMNYYRYVTMTILTWYIRWCLYRSFEWRYFSRFRNNFVFMSICQIYIYILVHMPCSRVLISRYVSHYLYQKAWSWFNSKVIKFPAEGRRPTTVDPMTSWFGTKSTVKIVLCVIKVLPDSLQYSHSNVQDMAQISIIIDQSLEWTDLVVLVV